MKVTENIPYLELPDFTNDDFCRAIGVLEDCIKPALPQFGFHRPFVAPGGYYGDMWWQLDFSIALMGLHWLNPNLARELFMNFETAQKPDGRIPLWGNDTLPDYQNVTRLQRHGVSSFPRIFDAGDCIAAETMDEKMLDRILDVLLKYLDWWFRERQDRETGLVSAVFEETFIPYLGYAGEYAPVDLNVEILHGCHVTARLAERLRRDDAAAALRCKARALRQAVQRHLWNAEDGLFAPLMLKDGTFYPVRMGGSFAALRYDVATHEQRRSMLGILTEPRRFGWGGIALTSVDRTDPAFTVIADGKAYNGNPSWSGSVWTTINETVIRGLLDCGEKALAGDLASHTLQLFKSRFCEFLNPDTGNPCGVMDYAWTAALCVDIIFSRLCGISVDMASRTLAVRPNLPDTYDGGEIAIRNLHLADGTSLSLHIRCGRHPVIGIETDSCGTVHSCEVTDDVTVNF